MEKNKGLFSFRKHSVVDFLDGEKGRKRKGSRLRQSMGFLLAAALVFNTLPASGLAVSASGREVGLCEHHTKHTPDCGYMEAQPCIHEHGEECYTTVTECVHTHTDGCYPEAEETEASAGEGNATASDAEDREPENCTHQCSEESGCITKSSDCHHEHDESCGYKEAQECSYVCEICNGTESEDTGENTENTEDVGTDTAECICKVLCTEDSINGDCPVCGADDAGFLDCKGKVSEENTENQEDTGICKHHQEHDADCGYIPKSEDGEGSPCTYKCHICPVEDMIAALPDTVTEDNAADVRVQLEEILALFSELTEEEQEQIDLSRCYELQGALDVANDPMPLATGNVVLTYVGQEISFTVDECGNNCQGHTITQNVQGGVVQDATILVESGTHNITFSGLNLSFAAVGIMPGGTMNLTLGGTNKIVGSNCGFYVPVGATLVITEQSTGSLDISLGSYATAAGIGGAYYDPNGNDGDFSCGMVVINGGTITAAGRDYSAGIGGASYAPNFGNGGNITISGGHVTATGSDGAPGIGGGKDADSDGSLTLSSADVLYNSTTLGSKGKYTINGVPTEDMISVPADMHYISADMAAEIAGKVTLSGGVEVCGKIFKINTEGWNLEVTKKSDLEYIAAYTHADKGTVSKSVIILPCIHNNGAALTHHEGKAADCTQTGVKEYWDCSVCGKKFSDKDGQTEITNTEIPIAAHSLSHHEKVEADCTHTGVVEYWNCSVCGKKFSDKDGQTEITNTEIPIAAHVLTHHERNEADCTQAGVVEYWDCSVCRKKFSDKDGQIEISDANTVIPVKSHTLTHHAGVEAGCLTEGNIEYWSCSVCSKLFSDADGKIEVTDIKTPAKGHDYVAWESNGNGTHTHSCQTPGCGFTETGDCSGGTATYTEKAKCEICEGEYGERLKDTGAPTGEISIGTNKWNSFLNMITFGLFFKKTEQVTITAADNESGVASVSYYISDSKLTEEEVKVLDNWTAENTDKTTFNISPDKSCVVYAKITDNQGNVTYISSNGLVFDGTSPSITGIADGETYCTSQEVTVTDNNSESVTVTVNGKEQTLSDGKFTLDVKSDTATIVIAAEDIAGNVITVTVYAGHNYGTDWKSDSNGHWQECVVCGNKSEVLAHTEDSGTVTKPATQTETGIRTYKCSICGCEMRTEIIEKLPESHKHSYGAEWKSDSNNHWHECDCGAKSDSGNHTEDSGTVTKPATETETGVRTYKCSVCGYKIRTEIIEKLPESHKHSYGTEWKSDSNNHWHECDCGAKSDSGNHTEDSGSVTKPATETETGIRTYKCSVCGYKIRTEIIEKLPESHKHSYGTEWKSDNSNHWHECSCGEKNGTAAHTWDSGTVTVQPTTDKEGEKTFTCTVCGRTKTESVGKLPQSHTHSYGTNWKSDSNSHWHECDCGAKNSIAAHTWDSGTITVQPTTDREGEKRFTCTVCGRTKTETVGKLPPSHTHSYGTEWKSNSNNHWHECDCGAKNSIAAHTWDSGTITVQPTTDREGEKTFTCTVCGRTKTESVGKLPPSHTHSYGTEWKSNSNNHWHECDCGAKNSIAAHTWDSGTITVQPTTDREGEKTFTCTVCGRTKTETVGKLPPSHTHSYGTEWKSNSNNHWHECDCGAKNSIAAHTWDSGTITVQPTTDREGEKRFTCTVCGRTKTETVGKLSQSHTESSQPGDKKPDNSNQQNNGNTEDTKVDTGIPFIKDEDGKNGWNVIRTEEEKAEEGSIINVDMNGSTVVPGDIFDSIKGRDITITFDMGNGIIWSVNGKSITTDKADDINFSIKTGTNAIPVDIVNNITGERYSIQLSLSHEGEFGFTAILSINLGKDNAGLTANLYYYNESTGELEFICADTVAEDGMVSLAFTHASDYAVVIDADSMEQETGAGSTAEAPKTGEESTSADTTDTSVKNDLWNRIWVFVLCGVLVVAGLGIFFVGRKKNSKG